MSRTLNWAILVLLLAVSACADEYRDLGQYRIVTAGDGLGGLRCQPRTDFYYLAPGRADAEPVYLGTCGTPQFVTGHLDLPGDPSCFALSADGDALVYFHRPQWCGAGDRAQRKPGGVFRHTPEGGDRQLYTDAQVGQIWSRAPIGPSSIRVTWHHVRPSPGGAVCSQRLLIHADGTETPEGEPHTVHGCPSGRDEASQPTPVGGP